MKKKNAIVPWVDPDIIEVESEEVESEDAKQLTIEDIIETQRYINTMIPLLDFFMGVIPPLQIIPGPNTITKGENLT